MSKKIKPYTLSQAQALVEHAKSRSRKRHARWRTLLHLYRYGTLEAFLDSVMSDAGITSNLVREHAEVPLHAINMVLPHANILVNSTITQDPKLSVSPSGTDPAEEERAAAAQAIVAIGWAESEATDTLKRCTHDCVKLGYGVLKVGWTIAEADIPVPEHVQTEVLHTLVAADLKKAQHSGQDPTHIDELLAAVPETENVRIANKPYVDYVSPFDLFVPHDARRLDEARWVAQRLSMPVDEVEANESYNSSVKVISGGYQDYDDPSRDGVEGNSVFEYATIYEFYDLRTRRMLVFQLNTNKALYDGPMPEGLPYGSPFVELRNYEVSGDEFWPFGDLDNIAPLAHLANQGFTEQMDNMQASSQQYVTREEWIDDDEADAIERGIPRQVIRLKNLPQDMRPSDAIQIMQREPLSADVYNGINGLLEYMRQILGINDFHAGGSGADRMSATAASLVDGVSSTRGIEKRAAVERAAEQIGQRLLWLYQVWMDEEEWVRINGPTGASWAALSSDDLKGTFKVKIEGGSTSQVNPATKAAKAIQAIQVLVPAAQSLNMDVSKLFRQAVRDMGYNPDLLTALPPPPDPNQPPAPDQPPADQLPPDPAQAPAPAPFPDLGQPILPPATATGQPLSDQELLALLAEQDSSGLPVGGSGATSLDPTQGLPQQAQLGGASLA